MEFRNYHKAAELIILNKLKNKTTDNVLFIMPPGTGKTTLIINTLLEAISSKVIKKVMIIVHSKILKEYLENLIFESNLDPKDILIVLLNKVDQLITQKIIESDQFELIIFDDIVNKELPLTETFNFFTGIKWGLSNTETSPLLSLFNKTQYNIDFKLSFDADSNTLVYKNHIETINLREFLVDSFKLSLNNVSNNDLENEYFKHEYIETLEFLIQERVDIKGLKDLIYRKKQLDIFEKLLNNPQFFNDQLIGEIKEEKIWQNFFELNTWIFGLGFNLLFNSPLEGAKLEQVVAGYSIKGGGKRIDALMRTRGEISSLCFVEIKTHRKSLLKNIQKAYRPEAWAISEELSGGIAQVQKTIHKSLENINSCLKLKDDAGFLTGESLYLIRPKSFLLIGSLNEFKNDNENIHEDKFISFELFRRSINDIDIITFDELYRRAVAVIGNL